MLNKRANSNTPFSLTQIFIVTCAAGLVLLPFPLEAKSNIANQRFLDNAIQFDDDEGLRTRTEGPGLDEGNEQAPGVIVVTQSAAEKESKPEKKSKRGGFSFSDMAKSTQQAQPQRSGVSFGDMARSARRPKPRLQLRNKTQKTPTRSLLISR